MLSKNKLRHLARRIGVQEGGLGHRERLICALGGFFGVTTVVAISHYFLPGHDALLIIASMGASAVLLFAAPHGALSQPWPLLGGNFLSALVGVTCAIWIPHPLLAAGAAVGLAILLMHYLRCLHPPGGATALIAVIGGPQLKALGYEFALTPVLLNATVLLACAVAFNACFPWRRYPASWARAKKAPAAQSGVIHEDVMSAFREIGSFVDVTEEDLLLIHELLIKAQERRHLQPEDLRAGSCYSNGAAGESWAVRQIIDESDEPDMAKRTVIYKNIAGPDKPRTGVLTRAEFAKWARYEIWREMEDRGKASRDDGTMCGERDAPKEKPALHE